MDATAPPPTGPSPGGITVGEAMHPGLISCAPDTPLRDVARMMATYRVHAILVTAHGGDAAADARTWGIVGDDDLLGAAADGDLEGRRAGELASTPTVTVSPSDPVRDAVRLMSDRGVAHLLAVEQASGRPVGVLSRLDVARALAGFA